MIGRTYGQIRQQFARVAFNGLCDDDPKVLDYFNQAQEMLINSGKWSQLVTKFKMCTTNCCVSLPRQFESIIGISIQGRPTLTEGQLYEVLNVGPGTDHREYNAPAVIDQGWVPTHHDVCGQKLLRVYTDIPLPASASAYIQISGLDENNEPIQTPVGGNYIDGERISLSASPVTSTKTFTRITKVIKAVTQGRVRLYQVDATTGNEDLLAIFEPGETFPSYRRYKIPKIDARPDNPIELLIVAKQKFVPVVALDDEIQVTNLQALKFAAQALQYWEAENFESGELAERKALQHLDRELKQVQGGNYLNINLQMPTLPVVRNHL